MKGVENMSELNYSFLHLRSVSVRWSAARMCVSDCYVLNIFPLFVLGNLSLCFGLEINKTR